MADDNVVKIKVDGDTFELDMTDLTLAEIGAVEDLTGKSVQDIDWDSARGMQGMMWIMKNRRDPRFTIEDAGRIKFTAFEPVEDEEPRPTPPAKARGKSGAASS